MIRRTFVCEEHEEYGSLGWRPEWMPNAEPYGGMAVAHDMLEHEPNDDGGAEAEFRALGAALWLRGDTGYFQNGRPGENLASDIPDILGRVWYGGQTLTDPGRTYRLPERAEIELNRVRSELRKHYQYEDPEDRRPTRQEVDRILGWMRRGYRGAIRRFRRLDNYSLCHAVYQRIENTADALLRHAEEGQRMIVRVNLRRCDVDIQLEEENYE